MPEKPQPEKKQLPKMLILADKDAREGKLAKAARKTTEKIGLWLDINAIPLLLVGGGVNTYVLITTGEVLALILEILYVLALAYRFYLFSVKKKETGFVGDARTGEPLSLASVRVEHKNQFIQLKITDESGRFFFLLPTGKYVLHVSRMGYAPQTKPFYVSRKKHIKPVNLDFKLTKQ